MKSFPVVAVVVTLIIIVGGILLFSKNSGEAVEELGTPPPLPSSYEYFWGEGCQHCEVVAEFFDDWESIDKVQIEKKEVWYNEVNERFWYQRAAYCEIERNDIAVPFLFTVEGECIIGDTPIIDYFESLEFEEEVSEEESN